MKDYVLKDTPASITNNDPAPVFLQKVTARAKASNEITGLIRGLLADGSVSKAESDFLKGWIEQRPEMIASDPIIRSLAARIGKIYSDGIVSPDELEELKSVLSSFSPENQAAPTTLPLDAPAPTLSFPQRAFCLTGTFASGKRAWCEDQVTVRGGILHDAVRPGTHYLVIGTKVSAAWISQSYGRKIQAAAELKQNGIPISIVTEEHWLTFLTKLNGGLTTLQGSGLQA